MPDSANKNSILHTQHITSFITKNFFVALKKIKIK
jgi:hypothetical protein